jgi:hypothetical protein
MKNTFYLLLILLSFKGISQATIVDNTFKFDFKKAIKNSRLFEVHNSGYFVQADKDQQKIQIRFKIKSVSNKKKILTRINFI